MSLPSGYTRLEYIESSGTQYVDSGIVADISTVVSIEFSLTSSDVTTIVGWVQDADSGSARTALFQYNGQWVLDFGGESNRLIGGTISANTKYSVEFGNFYVKNLATGANILTGSALSSGNFGTGSLCLCGEISSLFSSGKWYGWKIQKGGTLLRDFIPCKNASGTVGLWDDVNSQFYGNAGTGAFTAGPAVLGSHKTMVGGTIYDVTAGKCMVGGTIYDVQKGLTMVGGTVYEIPFTVEPAVPVGTTWTITSSQSWEVPATGNYQVELHGGGGGRGGRYSEGSYSMYGAGGGGSGELYTTALMAGSIVPITIGLGGSNGANTIKSWIYSGNDGEASSFGSLFSIAGGGGGSKDNIIGPNRGGTASGSLATAGGDGVTDYSMEDKPVTGGYGNRYNTGQTYGNGASKYVLSQPGACIITYLGT